MLVEYFHHRRHQCHHRNPPDILEKGTTQNKKLNHSTGLIIINKIHSCHCIFTKQITIVNKIVGSFTYYIHFVHAHT